MKLITFLYELHDVLGVTFLNEGVRVFPNSDHCHYETISEDKHWVMQADTTEKVDGLDEAFVITDLSSLRNILCAPSMNRTSAVAVLVRISDGFKVIRVTDYAGNEYTLGILLRHWLNTIKVPPLKRDSFSYDCVLKPNTTGNSLLRHWSRQSYEKSDKDHHFTPSVVGGVLMINYEDGLKERHNIFAYSEVNAVDVTPKFRYFDYTLMRLMPSFKTNRSTDLKFALATGLMTIKIETTYSVAEFYTPGYK